MSAFQPVVRVTGVWERRKGVPCAVWLSDSIRPEERATPDDRTPDCQAAADLYDLKVTLVRSGRDQDNIDDLQATLAGLDAALRERIADMSRAQSALQGFRIRYKQEVGLLHEELDELNAAIAEAELDELAKRLTAEAGGKTSPPAEPAAAPLPRFTSDVVRKLFRDVAKIIHPDLAHDDVTRDRRHSLMVEANRAYALGDEQRLRWVLDAWERSPEAVRGSDGDAMRQRLLRRMAQVEEQLEAYAAELASLQASPLWQLKVMVDEASARGKDLMGEMVARLKRDILVARNRLDAIRWVP
jgi:hypothetical protein